MTTAEARAAYTQPVRLAGSPVAKKGVNGYFVQLVKKQAEKILGRSLNRAGVRIHTTMDSRQQNHAG